MKFKLSIGLILLLLFTSGAWFFFVSKVVSEVQATNPVITIESNPNNDFTRRINWDTAETLPGNWQSGISYTDIDEITLLATTQSDRRIEFKTPAADDTASCDASGASQGTWYVPNTFSRSKLYNNGIAVIIQPNNRFIEVSYFRMCKAADGTEFASGWVLPKQADPLVKPRLYQKNAFTLPGGHGGSHITAFGGMIRRGELTSNAPIEHVLSIEVDGSHLYCAKNLPPDIAGHVWPALDNDYTGCRLPTYTGTASHIRMGSLLALPPQFNCASLQTVPAKNICGALQTHGGLIVDNNDRPDAISFPIEFGVRKEVKEQYGFDMSNPRGKQHHAFELDIERMWQSIVVIVNPQEETVWTR